MTPWTGHNVADRDATRRFILLVGLIVTVVAVGAVGLVFGADVLVNSALSSIPLVLAFWWMQRKPSGQPVDRS